MAFRESSAKLNDDKFQEKSNVDLESVRISVNGAHRFPTARNILQLTVYSPVRHGGRLLAHASREPISSPTIAPYRMGISITPYNTV